MSDRRFIPLYSVGTTKKDDFRRGTYHLCGPEARVSRPAHLGVGLRKVLPLVLPSVRDTAPNLEAPFQLRAYPENRLTVQRMQSIDGWTDDLLLRKDMSDRLQNMRLLFL